MITYPQWKLRRRLLAGAGMLVACLFAVIAIKAFAQVAGSRTLPVVWNIGDAGAQATWLPIQSVVDAGTATSTPIAFSTTNGTEGSLYSYFSFVAVSGTQPATGKLCVIEGIGPTQTSDAGCVALDGGPGPFVLKVAPTPAPMVEYLYTPGSTEDGGFIVGSAHTCN